MAQLVKLSEAKPGYLSVVPRTHMKEGENQLQQVILCAPQTWCLVWTHTHSHTYAHVHQILLKNCSLRIRILLVLVQMLSSVETHLGSPHSVLSPCSFPPSEAVDFSLWASTLWGSHISYYYITIYNSSKVKLCNGIILWPGARHDALC